MKVCAVICTKPLYASRCQFSLFPSTKTPILCSGGLVCALSVGQQLAGSRKHPAGNQKKTAGNQKKTSGKQNTLPTTRKRLPATKTPRLATRNQPPGIKKGLPEPRDGVPADLYTNTVYCGLLEFVAVHGDEELLVVDCLLQSVLHKFHSLYAIHICQVVAQYPYSVYILRTVEKIISTGRT